VVEFTCMGIPVMGLNGGPQFPQSESFSFQVMTEDQEETDRRDQRGAGNRTDLLEPGERVRTPAQPLLQKKSCFISEWKNLRAGL